MKLNDGWTMIIGEKRYPCAVPCSMYDTLYKAGAIPDPYFGENEYVDGRVHARRRDRVESVADAFAERDVQRNREDLDEAGRADDSVAVQKTNPPAGYETPMDGASDERRLD